MGRAKKNLKIGVTIRGGRREDNGIPYFNCDIGGFRIAREI